jgi:hypothetical protein
MIRPGVSLAKRSPGNKGMVLLINKLVFQHNAMLALRHYRRPSVALYDVL